MRRKHPIRRFFTLLLIAAMVAGLAALPMLTANRGEDENKASILAGLPQQRTMTRQLHSGGYLVSQEAEAVSVPEAVYVTEYYVTNGQEVKAGDPVAKVDDVSVMQAIKSVQDTLDALQKQLQTVRGKMEPGVITVNGDGKLCAGGRVIEDSKLTYYTQFNDLTRQHREYEELLLELFKLHQTGAVTAPCNGLVGDLDKGLLKELSASGRYTLMPLARNTPEGDDLAVYTCYVQQLLDYTEEGDWVVRWGQDATYIRDFLDTGDVTWEFQEEEDLWYSEVVFAYENEEWTIVDPVPGDILLYAFDLRMDYWVLRIGHEELEEEEPEETDPTEETEEPTEPEETEPTQPQVGGGRPSGGGGGMSGLDLSGFGGLDNFSGFSGFSGGGGGRSGGSGQADGLYSTAKTQLCTVTPTETMTIQLSIDEMDITALHPGMAASLTFEALPNQTFTAEIQDISVFGTNNGGSSKFAVTLELPCQGNMLPGMNANVTIDLEAPRQCITVPVAAIVDQGNKSIIYTAYDEKTAQLGSPVEVTLGLSDGEHVEILSGLNAGTSFWYSYYDTVEISTAVETRGMFG